MTAKDTLQQTDMFLTFDLPVRPTPRETALRECAHCRATGRRTNPDTWRVGVCPVCNGMRFVVPKKEG